MSPLWRRLTVLLVAASAVCFARAAETSAADASRPNILFVISDDQSWPYASAYGTKWVETPNFDRVAADGVLFTHAFSLSPGCAPSRAGLLTGRFPWELREAGTHASSFPADLKTYPDLLAAAGYAAGSTGKGWGPGNFKITGRPHNPAGPTIAAKSNPQDLTKYAADFAAFLAAKPPEAPFCYWVGSGEPHRGFKKDAGLAAGKKVDDVTVPAFLPDLPEVRSDLLDYAVEIETFDKQVGDLLKVLADAGLASSTLIVVTSDNGMPFPRAKANNYDYGTRMPLAMAWAGTIPGGRTVDDLVSFADFAPTFLEAAGVAVPNDMRGRSLLPLLKSDKSGLVEPERKGVYSSRERHSSSRYDNWCYPIRSLRTADFLYVRNFTPDRWPAGDPAFPDGRPAYTDIDDSPTKALMIERRDDPAVRPLFEAAVSKRPADELFDVRQDPFNLKNLAGDPQYAEVLARMREQMDAMLTATGDPRMTSNADIWESYPRYSPIRTFPEPK